MFIGVISCGKLSIDLTGLHTCEATIIGDTDDAIAIYAPTIKLCGQETIIALEKFEFRDTLGKAHFKIMDTIKINLLNDQILRLAFCNDWKTQNIILVTDETDNNFGEILKSWSYNENRTKLVEIDPANLDCLNRDLMD
jgi:hypothetical protein